MTRGTLRLMRALPLLATVAAAGCLNPTGDDGLHRTELARSRAVWADSAISSYTYAMAVQCACENNLNGRDVRVSVQNGAATGVTYTDTNPETVAPPAPFAPYDTVEDLFALIDDAISRGADVLQVGYDPALRYPNIINVDYDIRTPGDEVLVLVGELTESTGS